MQIGKFNSTDTIESMTLLRLSDSRIQRQRLAAMLFSALFLASNNNYEDSEKVLLTVVMTDLVLKGYSRQQENEADAVALSHLKRIGMDHLSYKMVMGKFIDMRQ